MLKTISQSLDLGHLGSLHFHVSNFLPLTSAIRFLSVSKPTPVNYWSSIWSMDFYFWLLVRLSSLAISIIYFSRSVRSTSCLSSSWHRLHKNFNCIVSLLYFVLASMSLLFLIFVTTTSPLMLLRLAVDPDYTATTQFPIFYKGPIFKIICLNRNYWLI